MLIILYYNTLLFKGRVSVKKYPESRFNTLTKKAFDKSCFVIQKSTINAIYMEFNKSWANEIQFLWKVVNKKDRVSCVINQKSKFEYLKQYMSKIQWYDLTVSYMMSKEDEYKHLLGLLMKQKKIHYLTLWINTLNL